MNRFIGPNSLLVETQRSNEHTTTPKFLLACVPLSVSQLNLRLQFIQPQPLRDLYS